MVVDPDRPVVGAVGADERRLRGHDDIYHGNVFANIRDNYNVLISNTSIRNGAETWPIAWRML